MEGFWWKNLMFLCPSFSHLTLTLWLQYFSFRFRISSDSFSLIFIWSMVSTLGTWMLFRLSNSELICSLHCLNLPYFCDPHWCMLSRVLYIFSWFISFTRLPNLLKHFPSLFVQKPTLATVFWTNNVSLTIYG